MRKKLFFAVILTAIFIAACGKQEKVDPKETLVQEFEQYCQDPAKSETTLSELEDRLYAYEESDFSKEQLNRLNNAASKIGLSLFTTYTLSPNFEENLKKLEEEYLESEEQN